MNKTQHISWKFVVFVSGIVVFLLIFIAYVEIGKIPDYLPDTEYTEIAKKHLGDAGESTEGLKVMIHKSDGFVYVNFFLPEGLVMGGGFVVKMTADGEVKASGPGY